MYLGREGKAFVWKMEYFEVFAIMINEGVV